MSEVNNLVKSIKLDKFTQKDSKELKTIQSKIDKLHKQKRIQDKKIFEEQQGQNLRNLKKERESLKSRKQGKVEINISNEKFNVSKKYLDSLKDPEKYLKGLYGRKLRNYQKKAYKEKDYQAIVSLDKKLKGINQKTGLSKYKLSKSKKEVNTIEKAFEIQGIKIPRKKEKKKDYTPIATKTKSNQLTITFI
jgi:hypothetical protein